MQKRESKSEAFSAAPFDYTFCYAPLGDEGVYAYQEPWYGFSINRNSDETELSAEFLRFMLPHLDEMASRKGLPTVIRDSGGDPRYQALRDVAPIQSESCSDSSIPEAVRGAVAQVCCDFGAGVYQSAEEAAQAFVQLCRELLA